MPLTRDFRKTIEERVKRDVSFRKSLLTDAVECLLSGEVDVGKSILRDYINATVGFGKLAKVTNRSAKSLMRMFSSSGNPQTRNLFEIVAYLQAQEGVKLKVRAVRVSATSTAA